MAKKKPTQKKEPPPLTTEYHKARRQLVLWSGILFAWELIGIDLETMQGAGGTIGAFAKSLKSQQAVPWVLLILVGYFFYRLIVEWLQCDPQRREKRASIVDFSISLGIAIIAFLFFSIQLLLNIRIAEVLTGLNSYQTIGTLLAVFGFSGLSRCIRDLLIKYRDDITHQIDWIKFFTSVMLLIVATVLFIIFGGILLILLAFVFVIGLDLILYSVWKGCKKIGRVYTKIIKIK